MDEKELLEHLSNQQPIVTARDREVKFEELKPVVPQFVADWYEEHKDDFEYRVQCLCVQGPDQVREIDAWFDSDDTKPIETLVMMHKFGYEVKKEKLYTVELPNPNYTDQGHYILYKKENGKVCLGYYYSEEWKNCSFMHLTEGEIKEDFAWLWQFAEEVEE